MIAYLEQIVFWTCVTLVGYVYVGYPLLVFLVSRLRPRAVSSGPISPSVTILITAFNEELSIRDKLTNTLEISYPADKLEIIVASDGSTDGTDDIVREFAARGVRLFRQEGRIGKTATQNNAVEIATGDIVLFSDATTLYPKDVLGNILPPFADDSVGCVAGRLIYVDDTGTAVGGGVQRYWEYETFLKEAESRACSLIGASGCLYAVRREFYEAMYPEACSDFLICTLLYRKGKRSIFSPDALCFERTNNRSADELRMRVRIISQTFTDLWRNRDMLNPFKSGFYAVQLFSHKVLRYAVPLTLCVLLVSNILLVQHSTFYTVTLFAQAVFYALAAGGWLLEKSGIRSKVLSMPMYFVLANIASAIAFYKFLRGERYARWEPIR